MSQVHVAATFGSTCLSCSCSSLALLPLQVTLSTGHTMWATITAMGKNNTDLMQKHFCVVVQHVPTQSPHYCFFLLPVPFSAQLHTKTMFGWATHQETCKSENDTTFFSEVLYIYKEGVMPMCVPPGECYAVAMCTSVPAGTLVLHLALPMLGCG